MPKPFDPQVLNSTISNVLENTFDRMLHVKPTAERVIIERDIIEFESRLRLFPMEKFNGPCYIAIINYFLSQKEQETGRAIGTFIFYIKEEFADKLLRAFNRSIKDSENENSLMDIVGEMAGILAGDIKNEISSGGFTELLVSAPANYKNHVPDGALFDYNLFRKQELAFSFWNQKCIVIEACLGDVPQKV